MGVLYLICWLRHYPHAGGTRPAVQSRSKSSRGSPVFPSKTSTATGQPVVYLQHAGNAVASKSGTIPPFHDRVREFCHGITPLFLPAHGPGAPLALRHAA